MRTNIKGIIDRIENQQAVIIIEGEDQISFELPISVLPSDIEEGSIINLKISTSENKTKKAKIKVSKLIQRLKNHQL